MAWIEDRWYLAKTAEDGRKVPSRRNGQGLRWRVRYETPDGVERSKSFERKPAAESFRTKVSADIFSGTYLDLDAGKISLRKYAEQWLDAQSFDDVTRETARHRISHIVAGLGDKRLDRLAGSPGTIQSWLRNLKLAPSTQAACLGTLSAIFSMAVDNKKVASNPCDARSVKAPSLPKRKVVPLEAAQRAALRAALPERYRAMEEAGSLCGLRQGEIFGLGLDDIDFLRRTVHVRRQVKLVGGRLVFALPKRSKTRDVPLPGPAAEAFSEHIKAFHAVKTAVTLPWHEPGTRRHGKPVTVALMFTTPWSRGALNRHDFNHRTWKAALRKAKIPDTRENGMHVLRHSYASMLLSRGVDIKRVAECLGHHDPGFTLRVYVHLMEGGDEQVRKALEFSAAVPSPDSEPKLSVVSAGQGPTASQ